LIMGLFEKHKEFLQRAITALHERTFFAAYPENPSKTIYGENADEEGQDFFKKSLGQKFQELNQDRAESWIGDEESPYLNKSLDISYPGFSSSFLLEQAKSSLGIWKKKSPEERAGILVESLEGVKKRFFDIAYATMHTTGQGYMMAFQASGPHGADRALEAIAAGYEELKRFPASASWIKPMGKYEVHLEKSWVAEPKGVSLVIGCSTFPTWNSMPGLYASLITGNPVIVKPHPKAILPMAIVVAEIQKVLKAEGLPLEICQMAPDRVDNPITKKLAESPDVQLVDYTGGPQFGDYIEGLKGKVTFSEKTGVNSVILHSADDISKVVQNLSFSISLYSGQMCTAPQNIFVSKDGILTPEGNVSAEKFSNLLAENVSALVDNPKAGPFVLGAIQSPNTVSRISGFESGNSVLKEREIENPIFKNARTLSPRVVLMDTSEKSKFSEELFGPLAMVIETENIEESIELAGQLAAEHGAITCGAYSTDENIKNQIKDRMASCFTPVSFNLTGNIYLNQHAAFSDFHVTGGNPSGNASFTNPEFVIKRFVWVGFREPRK
jgi:phenylacetic acid degradation protein paaN